MIATPLTDAWREELRRELDGYGRKADLARHLHEHYGKTERSWQSYLQHVLAGQTPSSEIYLAIQQWAMASK